MKVTHEAGSVATKNLLDGQCEVFGAISEDRLCSGVAVLPDPFQNVNRRFLFSADVMLMAMGTY